MAVTFHESKQQGVWTLELSGIIEPHEHEEVIPALKNLLEKNEGVSLLVDMRDLVSWQPSAVWEELQFDLHFLRSFRRIAMVSDRDYQKWLATLAKRFGVAEIRYFHSSAHEQALAWLGESSDE
ncbi:STAS/SEC14 domain-containing protein [Roseibacillus persicicus]|uniref:STAS/SEC14 domain-containing protein n=1 Tax=Roseibacillus persicicus TaxID=454148 RepID=UPI00280DA2BF|nr:STAS/SEC14 domain-containing protein [Roseibacillus persicicus]MDQ8188997.1 STAS/SEC14 domain-containing protein [Roseibacillus persicicus]